MLIYCCFVKMEDNSKQSYQVWTATAPKHLRSCVCFLGSTSWMAKSRTKMRLFVDCVKGSCLPVEAEAQGSRAAPNVQPCLTAYYSAHLAWHAQGRVVHIRMNSKLWVALKVCEYHNMLHTLWARYIHGAPLLTLNFRNMIRLN